MGKTTRQRKKGLTIPRRFTKAGEKKNTSPLFSATVYTLGIIIIFTGLGLILALTLGAAGANQLASNPWINLFIAALFIYFAFSLFGHYEIQLPSSLFPQRVKCPAQIGPPAQVC